MTAENLATKYDFLSIIEKLPDPFFITKMDGTLEYTNAAMLEMFGFSREELLNFNVLSTYIEPEKRKNFQEEIKRKGFIRNFRVELLKKDKTPITCVITAGIRFSLSNEIIGYQGIIRDISDIREIEDKLQSSENLYETIFENSGTAMVIIEDDSTVSLMNTEFERVSGYTKDEVIGQSWRKFVPEEEYSHISRYNKQRRIDNGSVPTSLEVKLSHKQNGKKDYLITVSMIPKTKRSLIVLIDYSEQKQILEALQDNEEKYRKLVETSPDSIVLSDLDGKIIFANKQAAKLYGTDDPESLIGIDTFSLIAEQDKQRAMENAQRVFNGENIRNIEYYVTRKDGSIYPTETNVSLIFDIEGNPTSFMAVTRDISERKMAEQAIREREEQYRTLIETSPDAIIMVDTKFSIIMANHQSEILMGAAVDKIVGRNALDFLREEDRIRIQTKIQDTNETSFRDLEYEICKMDGSTIIVDINATSIRNDENQTIAFMAIVRDITQRKEMENKLKEYTVKLEERVAEKAVQLLEQEKVAMIGRLAGSIGHDINNPLQYVQGNAEMLNSMFEEENCDYEQAKELINTILQGCRRIDETCSRLRRASRKREIRVFNLTEALYTAVTMTRGRWKYVCTEIKHNFQDYSNLEIRGIENDISQLFMNLIINSVHALEDSKEPKTISIKIQKTEKEAIVLVEDNGHGIPSHILQKIGKESVTTKKAEDGTGLGLLWGYETIKQHNGKINIESTVQKGTTIIITLPLHT